MPSQFSQTSDLPFCGAPANSVCRDQGEVLSREKCVGKKGKVGPGCKSLSVWSTLSHRSSWESPHWAPQPLLWGPQLPETRLASHSFRASCLHLAGIVPPTCQTGPLDSGPFPGATMGSQPGTSPGQWPAEGSMSGSTLFSSEGAAHRPPPDLLPCCTPLATW